jgi:hypothetical protein
MQCPRCGADLSSENQACINCSAAPEAAAREPGGSGAKVLLLLLLLAACGAFYWYWQQKQAPIQTVDRFCSAVKNGDWKTVYDLIDWSAGGNKPMDEKTFVGTASLSKGFLTVTEYKLGSPKNDKDAIVIPVTVSANVTVIGGSKQRTDTLDIECSRINGAWKVRPRIRGDFLGIGGLLGVLNR